MKLFQGPRRGAACERQNGNGDWDREVVQRREGLRVHHSGRRRQGRVRPPHRHPDGRVPQPRRGPEGGVRGDRGAKGTAGGERPEGLIRFRDPKGRSSREAARRLVRGRFLHFRYQRKFSRTPYTLETSSARPERLGISCQFTKNSGLREKKGVSRASYETPPASARPVDEEEEVK